MFVEGGVSEESKKLSSSYLNSSLPIMFGTSLKHLFSLLGPLSEVECSGRVTKDKYYGMGDHFKAFYYYSTCQKTQPWVLLLLAILKSQLGNPATGKYIELGQLSMRIINRGRIEEKWTQNPETSIIG